MNVSSAMVSQAAAQMDAELEKWRERPLGEYPFLFLDAYYEQVREDGQVRHLAILVAVGIIQRAMWSAFISNLRRII